MKRKKKFIAVVLFIAMICLTAGLASGEFIPDLTIK
jgi:hypothetical protein